MPPRPQCSWLSTILNNIVGPEVGVTMLNKIVENVEQYGQYALAIEFSDNYTSKWGLFFQGQLFKSQ